MQCFVASLGVRWVQKSSLLSRLLLSSLRGLCSPSLASCLPPSLSVNLTAAVGKLQRETWIRPSFGLPGFWTECGGGLAGGQTHPHGDSEMCSLSQDVRGPCSREAGGGLSPLTLTSASEVWTKYGRMLRFDFCLKLLRLNCLQIVSQESYHLPEGLLIVISSNSLPVISPNSLDV